MAEKFHITIKKFIDLALWFFRGGSLKDEGGLKFISNVTISEAPFGFSLRKIMKFRNSNPVYMVDDRVLYLGTDGYEILSSHGLSCKYFKLSYYNETFSRWITLIPTLLNLEAGTADHVSQFSKATVAVKKTDTRPTCIQNTVTYGLFVFQAFMDGVESSDLDEIDVVVDKLVYVGSIDVASKIIWENGQTLNLVDLVVVPLTAEEVLLEPLGTIHVHARYKQGETEETLVQSIRLS